jgi:hypothetical protein
MLRPLSAPFNSTKNRTPVHRTALPRGEGGPPSISYKRLADENFGVHTKRIRVAAKLLCFLSSICLLRSSVAIDDPFAARFLGVWLAVGGFAYVILSPHERTVAYRKCARLFVAR